MEHQQETLIAELKKLNTQILAERSLKRVFLKGIAYGVGFFVGSAILAVIAVGIFGPLIANISWVEESFERGNTILQTTH